MPFANRAALTSRLTVVLLAAGAAGFLVGLVFNEWQVAVETAQVLAGLVTYPPENPFFLYHVKVWSLLHQICAAALRSGVSEATLSLVLSGMLGLLSFQALAAVVYALSRSALIAIGAVFVIYATRAAEYGVVYPIWLTGTIHTYGVVGLAWCVLSLGLLGSGWTRAGALMCGLAPAVHPAIGVWFGAIAAIAVAWGWRDLRADARRGVSFFAIGAGLTLVSLVVRLWLTPPIAPVDAAEARDLLTAFISFWDGHRRPVNPWADGVLLNAGALALALIWLIWFARDLPAASRLLLRMAAVAGAAGLGVAVISQVPIDRLPLWFVVIMPARVLNLNAMMFAAMVLGLIGVYRRHAIGQIGLCVVGVALLLSNRAPGAMGGWLGLDQMTVLAAGALMAVVTAVTHRVFAAAAELRVAGGAFVAVGLAGALLTGSMAQARRSQSESGIVGDQVNDAVFAAARRAPGLLLTGGDLQLIQLRTRRAVLIDGGGLDGLVYAPESAPAVDRVLRDVYGVDVRHPPEEARDGGRVPVNANRAVWEQYTYGRWQEIGRSYGITQVVTHPHWQLQLPVVASSPGYRLYAIPE